MARNLKEYIVKKVIEYLETPIYMVPETIYTWDCPYCEAQCFYTYDEEPDTIWKYCEWCEYMCPQCAKKRNLDYAPGEKSKYCKACLED